MNNADFSASVEQQQSSTAKRCPKCQFVILLLSGIIASIAIFFIFNVLPQYTEEHKFKVNSVKTYVHNGYVLIDADLTMNFSTEVIEALENGIPLTIAVEVQVYRQRRWWRNIVVKESLQLFELAYHPLTNVHVVKNLATGERYSFNSREEALSVLGTIRGAHLIKQEQLKADEQYYVRIRTLLDINHLPPALRQIAALSSAWRLESKWSHWPIIVHKPEQKKKSGLPMQESLPEQVQKQLAEQPVLKEPIKAQP